MDDRDLSDLLREWKAPDAPPDLHPPRTRRSPLSWLWTGTIRVPVPAALGALIFASLWIASMRTEPASLPNESEPPASRELARHTLTGDLEGFDAVLFDFTIAPGVSLPEHRHPGFVLGYIADGATRFGVDRESEQVITSGGTFFEPVGSLHSTFGSAAPEEPVRALLFMVVPTGSPLTGPP